MKDASNSQLSLLREKRLKFIHGLSGILEGLVADGKLNKKEIIFLSGWLHNARPFFVPKIVTSQSGLTSDLEALAQDTDYSYLVNSIEEILRDGVIHAYELENLKEIVNSIIGSKEWLPEKAEDYMDEIRGLVSGVISDDLLTRDEIYKLNERLQSAAGSLELWPPFDLLRKRIEIILADNNISNYEMQELQKLIVRLTNDGGCQIGASYSWSYLFDDVSEIDLRNSCICFVGDFVSGNVEHMEEYAIQAGAKFEREVTDNVSLLVVGSLGREDWFDSDGSKTILKALGAKLRTGNISIIDESCWLRLISQSPHLQLM